MEGSNDLLVTLQDVQKAHEAISPYLHRTPLLTNLTIDEAITRRFSFLHDRSDTQIQIAFKAEHLQKIGAFKARGALNAVQTHLSRVREEPREGSDSRRVHFVTHSSGNHAGALAFAARTFGCPATVVMPRTAPKTKKAAVEGYGAEVMECEPTLAARQETSDLVTRQIRDRGELVEFVHPYDEPLVIQGQGTLALEMMEQAGAIWNQAQSRRPCSATQSTSEASGDASEDREYLSGYGKPPFDIIIAPIGGGGMMSGVSTAVKAMDDRVIVVGAEPAKADDAYRSFESGQLQPALPPTSVCDGLLTSLSPLTFSHIKKNVDLICRVSEDAVLKAMKLTWERMKQIVEPSACVGLACLLEPDDKLQSLVMKLAREKRKKLMDAGKGGELLSIKIGVVWSGGNVELAKAMENLARVDDQML